jgi:hypothetical protein
MIGPGERGARYQVQIQRLLRGQDTDQRRIVCLSAILPDGDQLEDFSAWLRRDQPGGPIKHDWRATRLRFGEVTWNSPTTKHFSQVSAQCQIQRFASTFRNEHNVIFAVPVVWLKLSYSSVGGFPFVAWLLTWEIRWWTAGFVKLRLPPRHSRGSLAYARDFGAARSAYRRGSVAQPQSLNLLVLRQLPGQNDRTAYR